MKALSIRQPWAHLILHGGKDIENRDWRTSVRGRVLVHASKGMTRDDAYMLVSVAGDVDVTELVDRNKGVHVMMPKAIFSK